MATPFNQWNSGDIWAHFYNHGINLGVFEEMGMGNYAQFIEDAAKNRGWTLDQATAFVMSELPKTSGYNGPNRHPGGTLLPNGMGSQSSAPLPPPRPDDTFADPTGAAADEQNAKIRLKALLDQWGLGSLADWAYEQVIVNDLAEDFVLNVLLPDQEAAKARTPGNQLRKDAGLPVLSIGDYVRLEAEMKGQFRQAGLPTGFYDDASDFATLIGNDVSVAELNSRINDGFIDAMNAPADVRQGFAALYGVQGDANLAAYFINPAHALPVLERQEAAAKAYGAASRTGFGALSRAEAEGIAAFGYNEGALQQGFGQLASDMPLFQSFDAGDQVISREDQLAATFGNNANAARRVAAKRRRQQANFEGGGAVAANNEGFAGIG